MSLPVIFMDECGYTGQDLLRAEQPIFTIATLSCTNKQVKDLKQRFFSKVKAQELKHTTLAKRESHQKSIIELFSYLKTSSIPIKIVVVHKKYALVTKMIDLIVEELAYADGVDFYKGGQNIAFANLFFMTTPAFSNQAYFDQILVKFQELMRLRTKKAYGEFFKLFFKKGFKKECEVIFAPFCAYHQRLGEEIFGSPENALDVAQACALHLMAQWKDELKGPMELIHDESSNMSKRKDIWDLIVSPDLPAQIIGYDSRQWDMPIGVKKTEFINSRKVVGLQIADILAGAAARWGSCLIIPNRKKTWYENELDKIFPDNFVSYALWPSADVTPQSLEIKEVENIESSIDYVARIIKKSRK